MQGWSVCIMANHSSKCVTSLQVFQAGSDRSDHRHINSLELLHLLLGTLRLLPLKRSTMDGLLTVSTTRVFFPCFLFNLLVLVLKVTFESESVSQQMLKLIPITRLFRFSSGCDFRVMRSTLFVMKLMKHNLLVTILFLSHQMNRW